MNGSLTWISFLMTSWIHLYLRPLSMILPLRDSRPRFGPIVRDAFQDAAGSFNENFNYPIPRLLGTRRRNVGPSGLSEKQLPLRKWHRSLEIERSFRFLERLKNSITILDNVMHTRHLFDETIYCIY